LSSSLLWRFRDGARGVVAWGERGGGAVRGCGGERACQG